MSITKFESTLKELQRVSKSHSARFDLFNNYLNNKKDKIWRKHYPKKKKINYDNLLEIPEFEQFRNKNKILAEKFWNHWNTKKDNLKNKLYQLAADLTPAKTNSFIYWKSTSSYNYSSQGYGAMTYARNEAESHADKARFNELEVEVRKVDERRSGGQYDIIHADFEIWVKTDEIGISILDYGKDAGIVEIVRMILKRGGNPWVRFPYLPQNFMEVNKLDWYGNYIKEII